MYLEKNYGSAYQALSMEEMFESQTEMFTAQFRTPPLPKPVSGTDVSCNADASYISSLMEDIKSTLRGREVEDLAADVLAAFLANLDKLINLIEGFIRDCGNSLQVSGAIGDLQGKLEKLKDYRKRGKARQ